MASLPLMLAGCVVANSKVGHGQSVHGEIRYISTDLTHAAFFSSRSARFGPNDLMISSPLAIRYLRSGNVRCISVGLIGNSVEYAVQKPLKTGAQYRCGEASFTVTQCFNDCSAAVVLRKTALHGNSQGLFLSPYMYVDSCIGILVLDSSRDLAAGIPLDAEVLRGPVGILADDDYSRCS